MGSVSEWQQAQEVETEYHQEVSRGQLEWLPGRFDVDLDELTGNVLEVGCGSSGLTYTIASKVPESTVVGVDPILGKISNPALATEPVVQAAGESLPFPDDFFDVVASINVIDHAMQPAAILAEIARVTKPGGRFLFKINTYSLPDIVRNRLRHIDRPHLHHFSPGQVREMIREQGFTITHESVDSRSLFNRELGDWSLKWIAATTVFRFSTLYITGVLDEN